MDDFYLKYLSQECIVAEVFAVKGSGNKVTEKIGEAKLPLIVLLQNDQSFQAQEITCTLDSGKIINIGKVFYRARMRRSLNEAMKWLKIKNENMENQV